MSESVRYASGEVPEVGDRVVCTEEQFKGDNWCSKYGDENTVVRLPGGGWIEIDKVTSMGANHRALAKWFSKKTESNCSETPNSSTDWQPFDGTFRAGVVRIRKKPVEVAAMRYDGTMESFNAIHEWMGPDSDPNHPNLGYQGTDDEPGKFGIKTLEGRITASPGDWIIKGVMGEFYPCKPDVFIATYDITHQRPAAAPEPVAPAAPAPQAGSVERRDHSLIAANNELLKLSAAEIIEAQPRLSIGTKARNAARDIDQLLADYDAMKQRCEAAEGLVADLRHQSKFISHSLEERNKDALRLQDQLTTLTAERDALQKRLDAIAAAVGGAKGGA